MKAQLWEIYVSDGMMGAIHGMFSKTIEVYIPCLGITCNLYSDKVNFFRTEDRYSKNLGNCEPFETPEPVLIKEIEFPDDLANSISSMLTNRENFSKAFKEFFESIPYVIEENKMKEYKMRERMDRIKQFYACRKVEDSESPDKIE